jgi:hypothetical protein
MTSKKKECMLKGLNARQMKRFVLNLNAVRHACCRFFMASATSSSCTSPVFGLGNAGLELLPPGEGFEGFGRRDIGVGQREPRLPIAAL